MQVRDKIRSFILENFLFTDDQSKLQDNQSFIETGLIDSTGILEVISFLQDEFVIDVQDEEMVPDNLDSVDRIVNFVCRKKAVLEV